MSRVFIFTSDVMELTGFGSTASKLILSKIRNHCEIPKRGQVTVAQFCEFMHLDLVLVLDQINGFRMQRG